MHNVLCDGWNWRVQCACIPKPSVLFFSLCVGRCYSVKCTYSLIHLWSQQLTICAMETRTTVYLRITTTIPKVPIHTCVHVHIYSTYVHVYYRYAVLKYICYLCVYVICMYYTIMYTHMSVLCTCTYIYMYIISCTYTYPYMYIPTYYAYTCI